ncbi:uncharacterized protein LOC120084591 [Benincasa hispida]|uniref:uncharacterized protein LOC120084591 n=1 Tax=Benincasa hispida TaxID=102211 RepID=UPI001901749B|nr:uncharacterized protein LOC120084591 [Benincasa hispida]
MKRREDDKEVFGSILSNLEKGQGLPEAGVVNQPVPLKEAMEEESRRSALDILDPKETANAESYEGPIRVALEEAAAERQLEGAEEKKKKKKKSKEKRDEEDEQAHRRFKREPEVTKELIERKIPKRPSPTTYLFPAYESSSESPTPPIPECESSTPPIPELESQSSSSTALSYLPSVPDVDHDPALVCRSARIHYDGSIERYKAHLVAKGYLQEYGIDYEETFAPVARMTSVGSLLVVAATSGTLLEEVYMQPPPDVSSLPNKVCLLHHAIIWTQTSSSCLVYNQFYYYQLGFSSSTHDSTLFIRKTSRGIVLLLLYVDDMIIIGDDPRAISNL